MKTVLLGAVCLVRSSIAVMMRLAALAALYSAAMVGLALSEPAVDAPGDSCTINLKDGLKEPGQVSSGGSCCSVLHADKCVKKSANGGYDEVKKGGSKNPKKGVTIVDGIKQSGGGTTHPPKLNAPVSVSDSKRH